jgi:His-Xaa-Ser system protein HxsD
MLSSSAEASSFSVIFPLAVYSIEAVKRAVYVLMPRATVKLDVTNETIHCTITPLSDKEIWTIIERDFLREVNDQDLRLSIEAATEQTRTAILGLTFSRTGLQE